MTEEALGMLLVAEISWAAGMALRSRYKHYQSVQANMFGYWDDTPLALDTWRTVHLEYFPTKSIRF